MDWSPAHLVFYIKIYYNKNKKGKNIKQYRLIEESKLRKLIESDMIYNELCVWGVDNWTGSDFVKWPDIDDIEKELNKYDRFEEHDFDD